MKRTMTLIGIAFALSGTFGACGRKQPLNQSAAVNVISDVNVSRVTRSSIADSYEATGTVNAKTTTQVSANVLGRVNSIAVSEGDVVKKGQILVEIDDRDAQARLEKAQAGLREAQASLIELDNSAAAAEAAVKTAKANKQLADVTFARYEALYRNASVSRQEYDEALSKLDGAMSEFERSKANLRAIISKKAQIDARIEQAKADVANSKIHASYSRIVAPVSGVIVRKFVEVGAMASPGAPLVSIEDNSKYRLEAAVEESRAKLAQIGDRVNVRIDALGPGEVVGKVTEIMPTADPASRTYTVKIDLPPDPRLRTGLYGLARLPLSPKEAITVPLSAIVQRGQLAGVYAVRSDGSVQFRIVTTGKTSERTVEILSGINEGDEIATSEISRLSDGTRVR